MASVLILSDTHGLIDPRILDLAAVADHVVHAGDIGGADVLARIEKSLHPGALLHCVLGNNDTPRQWPAGGHQWLDQLPWETRIPLPGGDLVVLHGHRVNPAKERHRKLRARHPDARAIVYGHTHKRVLDTDSFPWVLNPGAAGRARTFGGPSCLWLHCVPSDWTLEERVFPPA